jgi:ABC-type glycerol-3-phosphate transport system substrate-binding protein
MLLLLSVACIFNNYADDDDKKLNDETLKETVLTVASFNLNIDFILLDLITEFNHSNPLYQIEIVDYYDHSLEDKGLSKLVTDIITGNAPDIFVIRNLPYRQYASRGLFEDLYSYIDSDPDLNRSDIVDSILTANEVDGGLYRISPLFAISTAIGGVSVVGIDNGWNMDEFISVMNANPQADIPVGAWAGNYEMLFRNFLLLGMDDYVDWSKGETFFDTESFINLLELSVAFIGNGNPMSNPEDRAPVSILSGRQILYIDGYITAYQHIQTYQGVFGGDIAFKGFPTNERNGNSFNTSFALAMSSTSSHKDGAWAFLRTMLMKEWQLKSYQDFPRGFPTNKNVLNEILSNPDYHNGVAGWNDLQFETEPPSQAELEWFMSFINSIERIEYEHDALVDMVFEGVSDYFNGLKTAEEAARIIQSRASIYVAEISG